MKGKFLINDYTLGKKQRTSLSATNPSIRFIDVTYFGHLQGATNVRHNVYSALYSQSLTNVKKRYYAPLSSINIIYKYYC